MMLKANEFHDQYVPVVEMRVRRFMDGTPPMTMYVVDHNGIKLPLDRFSAKVQDGLKALADERHEVVKRFLEE